jgi:hypothetical protein
MTTPWEGVFWHDTRTIVPRQRWGNGPWETEPDLANWTDIATGLDCVAVRHPTIGTWCGYVGVTEDHPCFGKDYDALDLRAHGGINWASATLHLCTCAPNFWWFGFDCGHAGDYLPGGLNQQTDEYRTLDYVRKECEALARQLLAIKDGSNTIPVRSGRLIYLG